MPPRALPPWANRRGPPPLPRPDAHAVERRRLQFAQDRRPARPGRLRLVAGRAAIPLLAHDSLDLAVARGAAFYGLVRRGLGRRISGGAAHALYVGLDHAGEAGPLALCVVPRGQEEGETVELGQRGFQLALGRPVRFPLFSSASDRLEKTGDVVPVADDMQALSPIHTVLRGGGGHAGRVPVHLQATLTEIGTLELWCVADATGERWRLEFELRGGLVDGPATVTASMPAAFAEARHWVERIFGGKPRPLAGLKGVPPKDEKQLWASLERTLGPREDWDLPVLRELWSVLFAGAARRRRSAAHERLYFQLLGYTLRPGFGYALDEWRAEQTARLFAEGVQFHQEKAVWTEFWVLWRRLAGGLNEARHREIWAGLKPFLQLRVPPRVRQTRPAAQRHPARGPGRNGPAGGGARTPGPAGQGRTR